MSGKQQAASKTTMNLAIKENPINPLVVFAWMLVILAAAAALGKFGVADQFARVIAAQAEVNALRDRLKSIEDSYADYNEVEAEYNRYTYREYDRSLANRMDVLALLEREVHPVCTVQSLNLTGRQLNLTLGGLTLESTSRLLARLEDDELVDEVTVSTYTMEANGDQVSVTQMRITLADMSKGGKS